MPKKIKYSFVYAIKANTEQEHFKIGYSSNVNSRLKSLQTASPFPLEIVSAIRTKSPVSVERKIHRDLDEYRVSGEWFRAPENVIKSVFDGYSEYKSEVYLRWLYILNLLNVEYTDDAEIFSNCVYLKKEMCYACFLDYEPTHKENIHLGDITSKTAMPCVTVHSLPFVHKGKLKSYQSSIFLRVFAGSFCDVFDCLMYDMDFSKFSGRKIDDFYGRYRYVKRAGFYSSKGILRITDKAESMSTEFFDACQESMNAELNDITSKLGINEDK